MAIVKHAELKPILEKAVVPEEKTLVKEVVQLINKQGEFFAHSQMAANQRFIAALQESANLKKRVTLHSITRDAKGHITGMVMDVAPITE